MSDEQWYDEPTRWLQLNLVPDDVVHADVAAWREYWRDAKVQGLTISAAGATAHYPTDVPDHARSPFLGDRDFFGELVAAAKTLDIRVLARFEANIMSPELAAEHPDWVVQRIATGESSAADLALMNFTGGRALPCTNGPYYREFMPAVMTELAERYPIDGFYANGWPQIGSGPITPHRVCGCPSCRAARLARGHDRYPSRADARDPVWLDFVDFVQRQFEEVQAAWQRHVKAIRPGLSFVCNLHGALASGMSWQRFIPHVDLVANDSQARSWAGSAAAGVGTHALWNQALSGAVLRAVAGDRPVCHIVGAWHAGSPSLRRLAKEPVELKMMLAQVVAKGGRPWCNVAGATIYDRRWMAPLAEYYQWHAANEAYLRNRASLADVAVLWSPRSAAATATDGNAGPSPTEAVAGWYEALLAARTPFDVIADVALPELDRYAVVIVPSGTAVDAATGATIARFVERGGGLVLGCGSLAPAGGDAGAEATLADLAGVAKPARPVGPRPLAYLHVRDERDAALLARRGDTDYLPCGAWLACADPIAATGAARYQSPLPFLADLAFVVDPPSPAPVLTSFGRCVYLGTDVDCFHGTYQLSDSALVLHNALRVARGDGAPKVAVDGPGFLQVEAWAQDSSWTVHLVNLTNPRLYAGPIEELVDLGPIAVRLRVDRTASIADVRLLRHDVPAEWSRETDQTVVVSVPSITDFEVVAVDRHD